MTHYAGEQKIVADQVVYEGDVENVEINDEVIRTYCDVIGIDFDKEKELHWIAEEGMRAPIPKPWKACRDTHSDELYYFNFQTGESQWDHPLDEFYSKKVQEEREKLQKSKQRNTSVRNLPDHQNQLESRTQPFPVPGQARSHSGLMNTLPPDAKISSPSYGSPSPVKEDGKRFLKSSSKKSSEDDGFGGGAREERLMFDLDEQPAMSPPGMQPNNSSPPSRQEGPAYEDDYEEDVDFGDGDDRHLSEFLLQSSMEPELAKLASTGDHETGTSQFSQGGDVVDEQQTNNSGAVVRPNNPMPDSSRMAQSMTATSFDVSEYLAQRDPAEIEARLKAELHNAQLDLLEEHDAKLKQVKAEIEEKTAKEEAQLRQEALEKIQSLKQELASEIKKETALRDEQMRSIETARRGMEEDSRQKIEEIRSKTSLAIESERRMLENREDEVMKRLAATRADIDGEVDRRLGAERALLESEYAARVAVLRKELSALHESEMAKLRTELEEANYREQEAKRAEVRSAEQRVSSVRVLESEMGISLDRRRAELHEEHENELAKIRREQERTIAAARQDADLEISKAKSLAAALVEETRRAIADETERQMAEAKADGDRARSTALSKITGLEEGLKTREERVAKRQRELDELERRLNEKDRQLKSKQDELKIQAEEILKEENALANQKSALEKRRAEISGIQRSIAVDEMIGHHAHKGGHKGNMQKHGDDVALESHSVRSVESTSKSSHSKKKHNKKGHDKRDTNRVEEESASEESEESESESEEDATTIDASTVTGAKRAHKGKEKPPRLSDLLPTSSCSSDDGRDGLGRNGKKVRRMLLNLLFPSQKISDDDGADENAAHGHASNSTSSRHSKTRKQTSDKIGKHLANLSSLKLEIDEDDDDSDIDLNEIRSRIRSERLRAVQSEQRTMLQGAGSEQANTNGSYSNGPLYSSTAVSYRSPYPVYNHRGSTADMDRYLASRWYQLYRGSAFSSPLRSQNTWQWPLASTSTKYGYVPARDLLTQYSASKLSNSTNIAYRAAEASDYPK